MTRWRQPPQVAHERKDDRFDPVLEGARHGLSRDLALAVWARICAEGAAAERSESEDALRFREVAALIGARGGRFRPDVGRITRVDFDGDRDRWRTDDLGPRVPGKESLAEVEARTSDVWNGPDAEGTTAAEDT